MKKNVLSCLSGGKSVTEKKSIYTLSREASCLVEGRAHPNEAMMVADIVAEVLRFMNGCLVLHTSRNSRRVTCSREYCRKVSMKLDNSRSHSKT
jgi:hypothetical protein